jgi:uncharacterized protein YjbJ (UPF0337 family)
MTMATDSTNVKGNEVVGSAKEKAGEITGDRELAARGDGKKLEGKDQGLVGEAKDTGKKTVAG